MTNLIVLICSILITIFVTVSARKEIEGQTIKFFSEKDLRVFIKEKDHFDGVCRRKIQFTYGVGPTQPTQDNVYVPCYDNYDEKNEGNKYVITHILYSENPQTVIIITPKGTCEKYHNNGGTLAGPQTINGIQCVRIKLKTRGGVVGSMMSILHMMNPSNISGNSNISGSNVSGSELSGLSKGLS
ncbi:uncharacterized protein LOC129002696 [Macrosteles quadrilineatus]|uniref:uncharacterized protein LOC129002696 n=1 Tax=Macrosteles quadrilineatus TaxID=74068 RepID=UPI0023E3004C|nr:uncharacterized protein LOC129002696 [Macrosteles quadrilineatus]